MLGIADPEIQLPKIDPDARRRRLTALVNTAQLAREAPAVYVIEDVHWIDEVSESILADFLSVVPQTPSLVLATYRPEYSGLLSQFSGAPSIALAPLSDLETAALVDELVGSDLSVGGLSTLVVERASGNPFFAHEIVRDLAERGVLQGQAGGYLSTADVAEVSMPATVQATIAARIDRLDAAAKRTLSAAAVIGAKVSRDLLESLGVEPVLADLVRGEFLDQVSFTRNPDYVFHHPLIRTVAYESQLKSDRAELHRRLAAAIETQAPGSADENAALIAGHLEAAGDLQSAYGWHMRAAAWAANRDIRAARLGWERAEEIADSLPAEHLGRPAMRIAPRTMLCATAFRVFEQVAGSRFDELRELCTATGDKRSLAIATAILVNEHVWQARIREASILASQAMAFLESIGDETVTVGLSWPMIYAKVESAEFADVLDWSQRVIDLADGDATMGDFVIESPLAFTTASRAVARYFMGQPGWREDIRDALDLTRDAYPATYTGVVTYCYLGISFGVVRPDDSLIHETEAAFAIGEQSVEDLLVNWAKMTLGVALVHRPTDAERHRGRVLLTEAADVARHRQHNLCEVPILDIYAARERARSGDRDGAIPLIRSAVDQLSRDGQSLVWGTPATAVLVETLLDRGAEGDIAEAEAAIARLANEPTGERLVMRDIWLLRLRALAARARGDEVPYRDYRDRYRKMAKDLGFEGHMQWAEEMP